MPPSNYSINMQINMTLLRGGPSLWFLARELLEGMQPVMFSVNARDSDPDE